MNIASSKYHNNIPVKLPQSAFLWAIFTDTYLLEMKTEIFKTQEYTAYMSQRSDIITGQQTALSVPSATANCNCYSS